MGKSFVTRSAEEVRCQIAAHWLGDDPRERRLGKIELAPHQLSAIGRIRTVFAEFNGAFLCDVVGTGKTYIGIGVAREASRPVVIAPAGLRTMWKASLLTTGVDAQFVSTESLSCSDPRIDHADLIVVDEAHHFRNRNTSRHKRLAAAAGRRRILLMTATPIHNSRDDLHSLASLFLGSRAGHLSEADLARLVVRRERKQIGDSHDIPAVAPAEWLPVGDDGDIAQGIMNLPAPVPVRNAGAADVLVARGLLRQWASSESALAAALTRRLGRACALEASLEAGEYPSEKELHTWMAGDDATQLCFDALFGAADRAPAKDLLAAVRRHAAAVRLLRGELRRRHLDDERASKLRHVMSRHPAARIVAFSSFEGTVRGLYEKLARDGGVAALTSGGGRVAGGRTSRAEVIAQFTPGSHDPPASDRIRLLLTTDLLSEGVNLQKAEVAIHLDLPWTPARMEQRVGRLARMGSLHRRVIVYGLAPPRSAESILGNEQALDKKWRAAATTIGWSGAQHWTDKEESVTSPATALENVREILLRWRNKECRSDDSRVSVASVVSTATGFLALMQHEMAFELVCSLDGPVSDRPEDLERACRAAVGVSAECNRLAVTRAMDSLQRWVTARSAEEIAGIGTQSHLRSRRALLKHIDGYVARMPAQLRPSSEREIRLARNTVTQTHAAADENTMRAILGNASDGAGGDWIRQLGKLDRQGEVETKTRSGSRIRALLLIGTIYPRPCPASFANGRDSESLVRAPAPRRPR